MHRTGFLSWTANCIANVIYYLLNLLEFQNNIADQAINSYCSYHISISAIVFILKIQWYEDEEDDEYEEDQFAREEERLAGS